MSNFSNIGFDFHTIEDPYCYLHEMTNVANVMKCAKGNYLEYAETSGVAMYIQFNNTNEYIDCNPHFNGKSKRNVCLTDEIDRSRSILDGSVYAWAEPAEKGKPESGLYPFLFDVPDLHRFTPLRFPLDCQIQLSAFAMEELALFDTEDEFYKNQTNQLKVVSKSFTPTGLFVKQTTYDKEPEPPQSVGFLSGVIKEFDTLINHFTDAPFNWLLVETVGGDIDIVYDPVLITETPWVGGIVQGTFWLSGRLLDVQPVNKRKDAYIKIFSLN